MKLFRIATAFSITIIIETLLAYLLKIREKEDLLNIVIINFITNVALNIFIIINTTLFNKLIINIILLEILIIVVEGIFYKKKLSYKKINPFLISLILNTVSYLFSIIIKI